MVEILAVFVNDGTLTASALDGQLSGPARAFGLIHDLLTESIEADRAGSSHGTFGGGGFDFAGSLKGRRLRVGGLEPERAGIQGEQVRLLWWSVAKLGIAGGAKSAGAAEGAADLVTANRLSNVVDNNGSIVQSTLPFAFRAQPSDPQRAVVVPSMAIRMNREVSKALFRLA